MPESKPEKDHISLKEVARSIGWLDRMGDGELEFDSADWSKVKKTGLVHLEGRKGDLLVWATVKIKEVSWERDWPNDFDELDYVDCTCGHPNDDHQRGVCPYTGCGCGAGLNDDEQPCSHGASYAIGHLRRCLVCGADYDPLDPVNPPGEPS